MSRPWTFKIGRSIRHAGLGIGRPRLTRSDRRGALAAKEAECPGGVPIAEPPGEAHAALDSKGFQRALISGISVCRTVIGQEFWLGVMAALASPTVGGDHLVPQRLAPLLHEVVAPIAAVTPPGTSGLGPETGTQLGAKK